MRLIDQSCGFLWIPHNPLHLIEVAGRTCYKSEDRMDATSAEKFVRMILKSGHESVIEHVSATVKFITNRGVTHEMVRHRIAAYSQESTRYVNYGGKDMEFIKPVWFDDCSMVERVSFKEALRYAEDTYNNLLLLGWSPQKAREVLPNALKTEIVATYNMRTWRHVFKQRCSKAAHPQMRALMKDCLTMFKKNIPVLFEDINL